MPTVQYSRPQCIPQVVQTKHDLRTPLRQRSATPSTHQQQLIQIINPFEIVSDTRDIYKPPHLHLLPAQFAGPVVWMVLEVCPSARVNQVLPQRHCALTPLHNTTPLTQGHNLHSHVKSQKGNMIMYCTTSKIKLMWCPLQTDIVSPDVQLSPCS